MSFELGWIDDIGMHGHTLMPTINKTSSDGAHSHAWLVEEEIETPLGRFYKGMILVSDYDGAHEHDLAGARTSMGGEHRHAVVRNRATFPSEVGGAHDHLLGLRRTGYDGVHAHDLVLGGVTLRSLVPEDLHRMMREALAAAGEISDPAVMRSNGEFHVLHGDKKLSRHATRAGAEKAASLHGFLLKCGLDSTGLELEGIEWLVRETEALGKIEKATRTVSGGGLLGSLGALVEKDGFSRF